MNFNYLVFQNILNNRLRKIVHNPIHHFRYLTRHKCFRHLQTICLAIGFTNCAHQALASTLTAHPNIMMPSQLDLLENWWGNLLLYGESTASKMLLLDIRKLDYKISSGKTTYTSKKHKFYSIPDQWQGQSKHITVAGDCSPIMNIKVLMKKRYQGKEKECMGMDIFNATAGVPLKIIFFVRNPYDIISFQTIHSSWKKKRQEILDLMLHRFIVNCKRNQTLLNHIPEEQVFIWRFEEHMSNPKKILTDLCDFLGVEAEESYLNTCTQIFVNKNPKKNYREIDWSEKNKAQVETAIEQYKFLSGYSWD